MVRRLTNLIKQNAEPPGSMRQLGGEAVDAAGLSPQGFSFADESCGTESAVENSRWLRAE
jgi:hypothetical protein